MEAKAPRGHNFLHVVPFLHPAQQPSQWRPNLLPAHIVQMFQMEEREFGSVYVVGAEMSPGRNELSCGLDGGGTRALCLQLPDRLL